MPRIETIMWRLFETLTKSVIAYLRSINFRFSLVYAVGFLVLWRCLFLARAQAAIFIPDEHTADHGYAYPFPNNWVPPFLAVIMVLILTYAPSIPNSTGRKYTSSMAFGVVLLTFCSGVALVSLIHFGLNIYWVVPGLAYACVFAVSEGIRHYEIDYEFLTRVDLSETIKVAMIDKIYDRWFRYFGYLSTLGIASLVPLVVSIFFYGTSTARSIIALPIAVSTGYLLLVILTCCMWPAHRKTQDAERKLLTITRGAPAN